MGATQLTGSNVLDGSLTFADTANLQAAFDAKASLLTPQFVNGLLVKAAAAAGYPYIGFLNNGGATIAQFIVDATTGFIYMDTPSFVLRATVNSAASAWLIGDGANKNLVLGTSNASVGDGQGMLAFKSAATVPTTVPANLGVLYIDPADLHLKYRNPTTLYDLTSPVALTVTTPDYVSIWLYGGH